MTSNDSRMKYETDMKEKTAETNILMDCVCACFVNKYSNFNDKNR